MSGARRHLMGVSPEILAFFSGIIRTYHSTKTITAKNIHATGPVTARHVSPFHRSNGSAAPAARWCCGGHGHAGAARPEATGGSRAPEAPSGQETEAESPPASGCPAAGPAAAPDRSLRAGADARSRPGAGEPPRLLPTRVPAIIPVLIRWIPVARPSPRLFADGRGREERREEQGLASQLFIMQCDSESHPRPPAAAAAVHPPLPPPLSLASPSPSPPARPALHAMPQPPTNIERTTTPSPTASKSSVLAPPPTTKNHRCQHCGKQFRNNSERVAHERVHTGEKPFACKYCDKKFGQKGQAARHERVHTGGQPHACVTCGKRFPSTSNLKIHIRVHSGERPFGCSFCDKKFVQRSVRHTWPTSTDLDRCHLAAFVFPCAGTGAGPGSKRRRVPYA